MTESTCLNPSENNMRQTEAALKQLLDAAYEAERAMTRSLNLDLAVGNDSFEDVQELSAALDNLDSAIEHAEAALRAIATGDEPR